MSGYREQVTGAVRAAKVLSSTRCAWFGRASPSLPRKTLRALDPDARRAHLVSQLRGSLYAGFYKTGAPVEDPVSPVRPARCPELVEGLSEANAGAGCWTHGWVVRSVDGACVVGERDDLRLRAPGGSWRWDTGGAVHVGAVHVGASVDFLTPKEQLGISPGFYLAQGDRELGTTDPERIVRVYWNATAKGAVLLMTSLTRSLNELGVPFRFKVIGHPDGYTRCDAAVLYLERDGFERTVGALVRALASARSELEAAVPAFTKQLAPGVALAENPGEQASFGWHRCGLVAEALVDAHECGIDDLDLRVDRVRDRFTAAGLNLDAPYLNPGATDRYGLVA